MPESVTVNLTSGVRGALEHLLTVAEHLEDNARIVDHLPDEPYGDLDQFRVSVYEPLRAGCCPGGDHSGAQKDKRGRAGYVTTCKEGIHQLRHHHASVMLAGVSPLRVGGVPRPRRPCLHPAVTMPMKPQVRATERPAR